ncbi:endo-1,4-beta-xylanase [Actinotalea subterranea]|uniref:endo-1,4-beta-xylanase n=1 Tax=Actinotalea subterranea TaxID=2607497 RepID=UPI001FE2EECA|nr:endo-1,4-beta-xylanase [Actinotalea subterranea]
MQTVTTPVPSALAHRVVGTDVTLVGPDGRPLADQEVRVEQVRHAFGFGNIGFDLIGLANGETGRPAGAGDDDAAMHHEVGSAAPEQAEHLAELWLDVFNMATLPFYWRAFEPERGRPDTVRLRRAAQWFAERGVTVKGHPLVWHTLAPSWLLGLPTDEVERAVRDRITRDVTDMAGAVTVWDAINEVVIMPVFTAEENAVTPLAQRLGRVGIVRLAFDTARAADPSVTLLLNDFNLSPAYEQLVEECLEAGVRIDALGLQSHMHQGYWGEEKTQAVLERFARFGLPLHLTETTLVSGDLMPPEIVDLNDYQVPSWPSTPDGEARQADELVRHCTTLMAHPSVEAFTYWGISDDGAWLGAPAGLVRTDGTPKPAYDALRRLVKEDWWLAPTTVRTDDAGRVRVEGFAGTYRVEVGGRSAAFELGAQGPRAVEVSPV